MCMYVCVCVCVQNVDIIMRAQCIVVVKRREYQKERGREGEDRTDRVNVMAKTAEKKWNERKKGKEQQFVTAKLHDDCMNGHFSAFLARA